MQSSELPHKIVLHNCRRKYSLLKRKLSRYRHVLNALLSFAVVFTITLSICLILYSELYSSQRTQRVSYSEDRKIDWHDWKLIEEENSRVGIGEHGVGEFLWYYPPSTQKINDTHGYNGYLSDKIALNRSLKDLRPKECIHEKYSSKLPNVSVVVIFHNEHLSSLLRTCYSVWNRTPSNLLSEIILVDDASNDLTEYVAAYMRIVKLIRVKERSGLIKAREIGAKAAKSDILVFLDSHCEAYHNWLPPLLGIVIADEMANYYRTVMLPTIDVIAHDTFELRSQLHNGLHASRGVFNWYFKYRLIPLLPSAIENPSKPFETPVMAGGLFAIHAKFFWELGGYDECLNTYGGEQFELSFKIWLCGGRMLETACSRVGHIYRYRPISVNLHIKYDFVSTNYKRVAEVWLDEYKEFLYMRQPLLYSKLDPGDISEQKALKQRLQCKPFKWFMEHVAFDLLKKFPVEEPSFAFGGIKNVGTNLCADTMRKLATTPVGLYYCAESLAYPHETQTFSLTLMHDIRERFAHRCWTKLADSTVWFVVCQEEYKKQRKYQHWKYDMKHKWIINKSNNYCLDVNEKKEVVVSQCVPNKLNQMWEFGNINYTAFQTIHDD